jgi:hypothetical protein
MKELVVMVKNHFSTILKYEDTTLLHIGMPD